MKEETVLASWISLALIIVSFFRSSLYLEFFSSFFIFLFFFYFSLYLNSVNKIFLLFCCC